MFPRALASSSALLSPSSERVIERRHLRGCGRRERCSENNARTGTFCRAKPAKSDKNTKKKKSAAVSPGTKKHDETNAMSTVSLSPSSSEDVKAASTAKSATSWFEGLEAAADKKAETMRTRAQFYAEESANSNSFKAYFEWDETREEEEKEMKNGRMVKFGEEVDEDEDEDEDADGESSSWGEFVASDDVDDDEDDEDFEAIEYDDDDINVFTPGGKMYQLGAEFEDDYDFEKEQMKKLERGKGMPSEMRYFDTAKIYVKSGNGGNGVIAFRREKFVPNGGPSGGNGGIGGDVAFTADENMHSLQMFRKKVHHRAKNGKHGGGSKCNGANGEHLEIKVPAGTIVRDSQTREVLCELLKHGETKTIIVGGRGGRGNASFKTSKNKVPMLAELGEEGLEKWIELELKLVADVGVIGAPNAGKSSLLAAVSAARPKIADYPFTTIVPNLGLVERDYTRMVFADVPGLLEGASEGLGLGFEFLRHAERTRLLLHVVDCSEEDCLHAHDAIVSELMLFDETMLDKPRLVALNKIDVSEQARANAKKLKETLKLEGVECFEISAVSKEGVDELMSKVAETHKALGPRRLESEESLAIEESRAKRAADGARIEDFTVEDTPYAFVVKGTAVERFCQMTNWDYFESYKRFARVLKMSGIEKALTEAGAGEGDRILVGKFEFAWSSDQREKTLYTTWKERRDEKPGRQQGSRHWPHAG